ncbi:MAG: hypothetical protein JXP34_17360 [Planctomycetes bacterium]|nr:hypothetical protein [Planctomycetota bacterium]
MLADAAIRFAILSISMSTSLGPGSLRAGSPADGEVGDAAPRGLDARFVRMEIPASLLADEVFEAKITMRNTGRRTWGDGMKLRPSDPADATTWGTDRIYLGQGRSVAPGADVTFTSFLRAPGRPGAFVFAWRVAENASGIPIGEPTARRILRVEPRPAEPPAKRNVPSPSRRRVWTFEDFEYAGSFKLPGDVEGCSSAFAESGLALHRSSDGTKRLFIRTGLERTIIYEAEIPDLVRLRDGDHGRLQTAGVGRTWTAPKVPRPGGGDVPANAGYWWDDAARILYWSSYHGYTTERLPVLGASRLEDGGVSHAGPWGLPASTPWFKAYWGGVIRLPDAFADGCTGGRSLAIGFGGYYSICAPASKGPALAAIFAPDPAKDELDVVELLAYPWSKDAAAPRDGDYFVANAPWGGRQPESRARGSWTMDDRVRSGVFIDVDQPGGGHAYIAFAYLGTGRIGYDYGAIGSAGHSHYWYVYDPEDLGRAAEGETKPWEILPYAMTRVEYPSGIRKKERWPRAPGEVTGACFDPETRCLYLYQRFAIDEGTRELFPCIHAYRWSPRIN